MSMFNQSDVEIQTNLDTLTQFRSRQTDNLKHYKKATRKLNQVIKEVTSRLQDYQSLVTRKERLPRPMVLHHGFSWYIDQDEIWRFFIKKTRSDFPGKKDRYIIKLLKNNSNQLNDALKRCNREKDAIKHEVKFLNTLISGLKSEDTKVESEKFVQVDASNLKMIKKDYLDKFLGDFYNWKAKKLIEIDIPNTINAQLDKIFRDDVFLFQEFQTYDEDSLESERQGLFQKIDKNINDYILKEFGAISKEKIDELIQIQLSTLLKSYKIPPTENKHLEKVPPEGLKKIARDETVLNENDVDINSLKIFKRGELQRELKKYIKEYNLIKEVTVKSNKISLITRKLRGEGWDAKEQSVAVTLRKMGYGEEWKT